MKPFKHLFILIVPFLTTILAPNVYRNNNLKCILLLSCVLFIATWQDPKVLAVYLFIGLIILFFIVYKIVLLQDYHMDKFSILLGHVSLYYIFKISKTYQAKHLVWRKCEKPIIKQLEEKIICFTKYAVYIDSIVLEKVNFKVKYFYKVGSLFKSYWTSKVLFYWFICVIKRFPRDLNEIQSKYR